MSEQERTIWHVLLTALGIFACFSLFAILAGNWLAVLCTLSPVLLVELAYRIRVRQFREYEDEALIRALRLSLEDQ